MIEVRLLIDSIDYDSVAELLVPLLAENLAAKGGLVGKLASNKKDFAAATARKVLSKMSQEKKDELVVDLVNKKRDLLIEKTTGLAKKNGIRGKIYNISARKY